MNSTLTPASETKVKAIPAVQEVVLKIKQDLRMGREHQQGRINWITTIFMGLFHIGALLALLPMFWSWKNLTVFAVMYFFAKERRIRSRKSSEEQV